LPVGFSIGFRLRPAIPPISRRNKRRFGESHRVGIIALRVRRATVARCDGFKPVLASKGRTTVMKPLSRNLASAVVIAVALTGATAFRADDDGFKSQRNAYVVNKLVSDQNGVANFRDPVLRNAWGVTFTPGASPFWIADNASGCSTLYDGTGVKVALQVPIPLPDNSVPSTACQPASAHTNPPPPTPAAPTRGGLELLNTFL